MAPLPSTSPPSMLCCAVLLVNKLEERC
jgi:hypothetical protein